jgi:hypothetical protein
MMNFCLLLEKSITSTNVMNLDVSLHMDYLFQNFKNLYIKVKYTSKKLKKMIKSLKSSNSHGYDEISTKNHKSYCIEMNDWCI